MDEDNIQSDSSSSESNKAFRQSENGISMGFFRWKRTFNDFKRETKKEASIIIITKKDRFVNGERKRI